MITKCCLYATILYTTIDNANLKILGYTEIKVDIP